MSRGKINYKAIISRTTNKLIKSYKDYKITNKVSKNEKEDKITKRIASITETSFYYKYRYMLIGKLVYLNRKTDIGSKSWEITFVNDQDSFNLNKKAGWSSNKKNYLIDGVNFK